MEEFGGNGHDATERAFEQATEGAKLRLSELRRDDGILTRGDINQHQSVLHRAMTAVLKDNDYRQELKTAFFLSTEEADKVVAAINEAKRYGCSLTPILDWVIARSSGTNGARLHAIFDTISRTTFTTNYEGKKNWWNKANVSSKDSPISK